jgi:hypothetical protein
MPVNPINDPLGIKAHYEAVIGEPWGALESAVRSNPRNRRIFEMLDDEEWNWIEAERLRRRPWWKKLMRITE